MADAKEKKNLNERDQLTVDWLFNISTAFRYIWAVPAILLIPSAFVIYFTEEQNALQFVSIIAFAIVLSFILRALVNYSIRTLTGAASKRVLAQAEQRKKKKE